MIGCTFVGYEYVGQGYSIPTFSHLDPDHWLSSLVRTLKWYVLKQLDSELWDVRFEFPSAKDLGEQLPLPKSIIHFEIDDIQNPPFGFGDNIVNYFQDPVTQTLVRYEALSHMVNLDVGIWTSDRSGGVSARLFAYEHLSKLFNGSTAYNNLTGIGVEVQKFNGGQFLKEEINDIPIYRVTNMTLEVRLFSRQVQEFVPYIPSGNLVIESELEDSDGILIPNQN